MTKFRQPFYDGFSGGPPPRGDQSSHRIVDVDDDPRGVRSDVLGRERTDAVVVPVKEYVGEWSVVGGDGGAY